MIEKFAEETFRLKQIIPERSGGGCYQIWVVRQTGSARRPRSSVRLAARRQPSTIL